MMTDSPEGQTQSYSQEEEMRTAFNKWYSNSWPNENEGLIVTASWEAWQAALASQAEQVRKLETEARPTQEQETRAANYLQIGACLYLGCDL